ncbi:MAG: M43 family zinc metalloprotease [Bacteroidia bacterium]
MMQKMLILSLLLSFFSAQLPLQAQTRRSCSTTEYLNTQLQSNPAVRYKMREVEMRTAENVRSARGDMLGVVGIPVVVHIVYNQNDQNITDEQIRSQIDVLNQDFGRTNPDRFDTPANFKGAAANSKISFQLASQDPYGNPTNGITRTRSSQALFSPSNNGVKYSTMGGMDAWDTKSYLNIWVCKLGAGMLGYAQFPGGGPNEADGVVIDYKFMGTKGTVRAPFDQGRTCTHEVGHWLNLKHIWGDGPCETDDFVGDTPPVGDAHYGCLRSAMACDGGPAMVSNFMDYTDDACMNLFTFGQAERMRALFSPGGYRRQMLFTKGLEANIPVVAAAPQLLNASEVTALSARLSWSPVSGADSYSARFRAIGETDWASKSFDRTFVNATRLEACTDYEFQIQSTVAGIASGYSDSKLFRTVGCEDNNSSAPIVGVSNNESNSSYPTNLFISDEFGNQAQLNWSRVSRASSYKVQYKATGSKKVYSKTLADTYVNVFSLSPGVRYFYRVQAVFTNGSKGPYSEVKSFVAGRSGTARMVSKTASDDYFTIKTNPVNAAAVINIDLGASTMVQIEILDSNGEVEIGYDAFFLQNGDPIELSLKDIKRGNYVMRITDDSGFSHSRNFVR